MKDKHNCPPGFTWCKIKKECIPEEEKEKLIKKHQRYFFKGDTKMKKVEEAYDLLDVAFNEGFETFGKVSSATKQVDTILDMFKGKSDNEKTVDIGSRPYDHPKQAKVSVSVDECDMMGGGSIDKGIGYDEEEGEDVYSSGPNDIDHVPNQDGSSLYKSIRKQLGEWKRLNEESKVEYKKYFDSMLKKYGVKSPAELDDAKKKEFFDKVDRGWNAKKETD
jgi:hypothetical protein